MAAESEFTFVGFNRPFGAICFEDDIELVTLSISSPEKENKGRIFMRK